MAIAGLYAEQWEIEMKYECYIKPGFRCAEIDAASAEEAVDFFVSAIIDNLGPEHVVVNNLDTEDGEDPAGGNASREA